MDLIFSSIIISLFNLKFTFPPHSPQWFARYVNETITLMSFLSFLCIDSSGLEESLIIIQEKHFSLKMRRLKSKELIGHRNESKACIPGRWIFLIISLCLHLDCLPASRMQPHCHIQCDLSSVTLDTMQLHCDLHCLFIWLCKIHGLSTCSSKA